MKLRKSNNFYIKDGINPSITMSIVLLVGLPTILAMGYMLGADLSFPNTFDQGYEEGFFNGTRTNLNNTTKNTTKINVNIPDIIPITIEDEKLVQCELGSFNEINGHVNYNLFQAKLINARNNRDVVFIENFTIALGNDKGFKFLIFNSTEFGDVNELVYEKKMNINDGEYIKTINTNFGVYNQTSFKIQQNFTSNLQYASDQGFFVGILPMDSDLLALSINCNNIKENSSGNWVSEVMDNGFYMISLIYRGLNEMAMTINPSLTEMTLLIGSNNQIIMGSIEGNPYLNGNTKGLEYTIDSISYLSSIECRATLEGMGSVYFSSMLSNSELLEVQTIPFAINSTNELNLISIGVVLVGLDYQVYYGNDNENKSELENMTFYFTLNGNPVSLTFLALIEFSAF